jgi:hypothetical protein
MTIKLIHFLLWSVFRHRPKIELLIGVMAGLTRHHPLCFF